MGSNRRRWIGLLLIALGVALIVVDTTIVNVIVPSIVRTIGIDSVQTQWVQESYAITFAALLLVAGRVADIIGARTVFICGAIVFGAASVLAGLAPSASLLIGARFAQGVGGGLILPTSLSLLNAMFDGPARAKAFAVWGSTIGASSALGPLLGGWLTEHLSWRWAFGVNVPLVAIVVVGAVFFVDRSVPQRGRLDVLGAVLSVVGLGLLAFALIEGRRYGWLLIQTPAHVLGADWDAGPSPALVAALWSAVALTLFVLRQTALARSGRTDTALVDVRLFSVASFRGGNVATLIIGVGEFGIIAVLPLWLQFALGYTPIAAGAALVPLAVGSFVASGISFTTPATPLTFVRIGLALEAIGLAVLGLVAAVDSPWWHLWSALFVYGVGVGFATAQVTNVVLDEIPESSSGQASGIQSAFRQLGSALGIAVLTTTFFTVLGASLHDRLVAAGTTADQADTISQQVTDTAGAAIAGFAARPDTAPIAQAGAEALTHATTFASYLAAGFILIGLAATLLIPRRSRADQPPTTTLAAASSRLLDNGSRQRGP